MMQWSMCRGYDAVVYAQGWPAAGLGGGLAPGFKLYIRVRVRVRIRVRVRVIMRVSSYLTWGKTSSRSRTAGCPPPD